MITDRERETGLDATLQATFGGGCFWCLHAVFEQVEGVAEVRSGYCGGALPDPDYAAVCSGTTGHIEVVTLRYAPEQVDYADLLAIFFAIHDPTSLDRQGHDTGPQYRSAIFWHSEAQREAAQSAITQLAAELGRPVVTELRPAEPVYAAEPEHQAYFRRNPGQAYCAVVIAPKLRKFRMNFPRLQRADTI
ncbi:MAG: peptide-methionine (S)-S-oxide reductase MsrA [Propionivibrio sp.]